MAAAYFVFNHKVLDSDTLNNDYLPKAVECLNKFNPEILAVHQGVTVVEGETSYDRLVILKFESRQLGIRGGGIILLDESVAGREDPLWIAFFRPPEYLIEPVDAPIAERAIGHTAGAPIGGQGRIGEEVLGVLCPDIMQVANGALRDQLPGKLSGGRTHIIEANHVREA